MGPALSGIRLSAGIAALQHKGISGEKVQCTHLLSPCSLILCSLLECPEVAIDAHLLREGCLLAILRPLRIIMNRSILWTSFFLSGAHEACRRGGEVVNKCQCVAATCRCFLGAVHHPAGKALPVTSNICCASWPPMMEHWMEGGKGAVLEGEARAVCAALCCGFVVLKSSGLHRIACRNGMAGALQCSASKPPGPCSAVHQKLQDLAVQYIKNSRTLQCSAAKARALRCSAAKTRALQCSAPKPPGPCSAVYQSLRVLIIAAVHRCYASLHCLQGRHGQCRAMDGMVSVFQAGGAAAEPEWTQMPEVRASCAATGGPKNSEQSLMLDLCLSPWVHCCNLT
eukprot:scaffold53923_cov18-Tisochrysis_lutea.AAC.1